MASGASVPKLDVTHGGVTMKPTTVNTYDHFLGLLISAEASCSLGIWQQNLINFNA